MRSIARVTSVLLLAGAVALTATACGGGNEESATTTGPGATTTGATPTATSETTTVAGNPENGLQLFQSNGCGSCHTLQAAGATGMIGPNLDEQLAASAQEAGEPLPEFTRESIVDPDAFVAEGFSAGVMPGNFGDQLSDQELDDLVAFLVQSVQG